MRIRNAGTRKGLLQRCNLFGYPVCIVEKIEHLSLSGDLPEAGFVGDVFIVFHHVCLDGAAVKRRFLQNRDITNAGQRHVKSPWNRGCRKCQDINRVSQSFESLLMFNPEPLLLVNNKKSDVFGKNVFGENSMRPDNYIHRAFMKTLNRLLNHCRCCKSRQKTYLHRESGKPLAQVLVMLLHQNSRRCQKDCLFAVHNTFKDCAKSNLRFAESHISAQKPVHHFFRLHIRLDISNRRKLIFGLLKREIFFEFTLPDSVRRENMSFYFLSLRV